MEETTNPSGEVETPVSRIASILEQTPEPEAPETEPVEQEQPESQAEELTPDDIPSEEVPQPTVDAFEIVHNGHQKTLTREETIKLAQQGFDYTTKTQALAEQSRQVQERMQRVEQLEQVQPMLLQSQATVTALGAQLSQYKGFNWVEFATNNPLDYPAQRARYDELVNAYNSSLQQHQQLHGAVQQERTQISEAMLRQEAARVPEYIPTWKDPAKADQGRKEISDYLTGLGIDLGSVGRYLDTAAALRVAHDAAQYNKLVRGKADKVKQLRQAPPVTRPGVSPPTAKAEKEQDLRTRLKKSGDRDVAAALILNRFK